MYFRNFTFLSFFLLLQAVVFGFYSPDDGITVLTNENFDETVLHSRGVWVVEFYVPWCPYCKRLAPEIKKLAKDHSFKVGAINGDIFNTLTERYNIEYYPTIKIFGRDKKIRPLEYKGHKDASEIAAAAHALLARPKRIKFNTMNTLPNKLMHESKVSQ